MAAAGEDRVADRFGFEPAQGHAPEQSVLPVDGLARGVEPARLAIGRRQQDQPMQRLEPPAVRDIPRGQPVEQLRVRGRAAVEAEIAGRGDDPLAEVVVPEAVDHDPRRQGVRRIANPPCQGDSPIASRRRRPAAPERRPHRGDPPGRHLGPRLHRVSPAEQMSRAGLAEGAGVDRDRGAELLQP